MGWGCRGLAWSRWWRSVGEAAARIACMRIRLTACRVVRNGLQCDGRLCGERRDGPGLGFEHSGLGAFGRSLDSAVAGWSVG